MNPEKHGGINMGLRNMSCFRELYSIKTMRNVIFKILKIVLVITRL